MAGELLKQLCRRGGRAATESTRRRTLACNPETESVVENRYNEEKATLVWTQDRDIVTRP